MGDDVVNGRRDHGRDGDLRERHDDHKEDAEVVGHR